MIIGIIIFIFYKKNVQDSPRYLPISLAKIIIQILNSVCKYDIVSFLYVIF